jgi:hypothetical protein
MQNRRHRKKLARQQFVCASQMTNEVILATRDSQFRNFPASHAHRHGHGPTADLAIHDELRVAFASVQRDSKKLPAMQALDGERFVHSSPLKVLSRIEAKRAIMSPNPCTRVLLSLSKLEEAACGVAANQARTVWVAFSCLSGG